MRPWLIARAHWLIALATLGMLWGTALAAAAPKKEALAVAAAGEAAFRAGKFRLALEKYLAARQLDPSYLEFTYNAALAAERSGQLDRAAELYQAYLDQGGTDAAGMATARQKLVGVNNERSEAVEKEADAARAAGEAALAAGKYRKAWQLKPDKVALLYYAGRQFQKAGLADLARTALAEYMRLAKSDEPEYPSAKVEFKALGGGAAVAVPTERKVAAPLPEPRNVESKPQPAAPPAVKVEPPMLEADPPKLRGPEPGPVVRKAKPQASRLGPWLALGGSALVAGGGGIWYGLASSDVSALQARYADAKAKGALFAGMNQQDYAAEKSRLEGAYFAGSVVAIAGALGLAASAAWLALSGEKTGAAQASLVPSVGAGLGGAVLVVAW
ncbi:MAG: hypothetical protein EXR77_16550 [Myxococcales bacterium]|nr:hypothetical protein [Myxococcales bacterium]